MKNIFKEIQEVQKREEILNQQIYDFIFKEIQEYMKNKEYFLARKHILKLNIPECIAKFDIYNYINRKAKNKLK